MSHRTASLILGASLFVATAWAVGHGLVDGQAGEKLLAKSYASALAEAAPRWQGEAAAASGRHSDLWLSSTGGQTGLLRKPVLAGDRISIASRRGGESFEVVAVEMVDAEAGGLPGLRIQIVTARPDGQIGGDTVRFIFAVDGPATMPAAPKPEKVL